MDTFVMVAIGLMVLFGAALMGKMLKDIFPGTLFGASKKREAKDTPAE
ncbi:hypothetical protein [Roseovarius rhodophyticola]|uniref:Uncharacterized protein n=1 Tax=Roseovarius rhodophyticola TaxID=3080827 RepID=A0ABZ2TGN4_9RHOB|nr:hypothetical protein [Roseovarius sp. W115]MDV2930614.1 hypothetical protein [Roseovarius sp. W115]